jgi:tRNA-dihydrouridine synthase
MQRCRGAAMVANATVLDEVLRAMADYPQVTFSVKMRLGREQPDEWRSTIDIINRMPLEHVTIHPRTGRQQYKGELHMDEFEHILEICEHPIVFNGDITSPAEAKAVVERFPGLHALMIGRGLLARPTLAWEINNHELSEDEQLKAFLAIHDELYAHYSHVLSGDAHLLAKMRAVCEYAEDLLGHKVAKAVRKAKSAEQYLAGISALRRRVG